jgi:hypothetical protein
LLPSGIKAKKNAKKKQIKNLVSVIEGLLRWQLHCKTTISFVMGWFSLLLAVNVVQCIAALPQKADSNVVQSDDDDSFKRQIEAVTKAAKAKLRAAEGETEAGKQREAAEFQRAAAKRAAKQRVAAKEELLERSVEDKHIDFTREIQVQEEFRSEAQLKYEQLERSKTAGLTMAAEKAAKALEATQEAAAEAVREAAKRVRRDTEMRHRRETAEKAAHKKAIEEKKAAKAKLRAAEDEDEAEKKREAAEVQRAAAKRAAKQRVDANWKAKTAQRAAAKRAAKQRGDANRKAKLTIAYEIAQRNAG